MAFEAIVISYEGASGEVASISGIDTSPPGDGWVWAQQCSFWTSAVSQGNAAQSAMQAEIRVSFVTEVNTATVALLRAGLTGSFDKSVVIAFLRVTPDGPWAEYTRLELKKCGISEFRVESVADRPNLHCVLHCGEITIMTWAFDQNTRGAPARVTILNEV